MVPGCLQLQLRSVRAAGLGGQVGMGSQPPYMNGDKPPAIAAV